MNDSSERSMTGVRPFVSCSARVSCGSETRSSSPLIRRTVRPSSSSTRTSKRGGRNAPGSRSTLIRADDASMPRHGRPPAALAARRDRLREPVARARRGGGARAPRGRGGGGGGGGGRGGGGGG